MRRGPGNYLADAEFWVDPESPYHRPVFAQDKDFVLFCALACFALGIPAFAPRFQMTPARLKLYGVLALAMIRSGYKLRH